MAELESAIRETIIDDEDRVRGKNRLSESYSRQNTMTGTVMKSKHGAGNRVSGKKRCLEPCWQLIAVAFIVPDAMYREKSPRRGRLD